MQSIWFSVFELVGAPRFELGAPSPPDWCANRAALRSDRRRDYKFDGDWSQHVERHADEIAHASGYAEIDLLMLMDLIGSPMFRCDPSSGRKLDRRRPGRG